MSFYNSGQNIGGLGDLISGGEQGYTFGQGVKTMLAKRKQDQQLSDDQHAAAQQESTINDIKYGLQDNGPAPQPQKQGFLSRVGHALGIGGAAQTPSDPGMSVPSGPAMPMDPGMSVPHGRFSQAGPTLQEKLQTSLFGNEKELAGINNDASYKRTMDETNSRNAEETLLGANRNATELEAAKIRERGEMNRAYMTHGDQSKDRQMGILQHKAANLMNALHGGFLGGATLTDADKANLQREYDATVQSMEQIGGFQPNSLRGQGFGDTNDPNAQQPQAPGQDPTFGVPQFFGGHLPPAGDKVWESILRRHGKIK